MKDQKPRSVVLVAMSKTARSFVFSCIVAALLLLAHRNRAAAAADSDEQQFDSPRLSALAGNLAGGHREALDQFWSEIDGKGPLIERTADDPGYCWVTFIWRAGPGTRRVNVGGGPAHYESAAWLQRLGETDLWFRTERIRSDARFLYSFQVNRPLRFPPDADKRPPLAPMRHDPLNPRKLREARSILELPAAEPQPWLRRAPEVPAGTLSKRQLYSKQLKQQRTFTVYTPAAYDSGSEDCGLLVLFDGAAFHSDDEISAP